MVDIYSKLLEIVDKEKFEVKLEKDMFTLNSKLTNEEYHFCSEDILVEKIEVFINLLSNIDDYSFVQVEDIDNLGISIDFKGDSENEDLLQKSEILLEYEEESLQRLNLIIQITNLIRTNAGKYTNLQMSIDSYDLSLTSDDWDSKIAFDIEDLSLTLDNLKSFFEGTYVETTAFYENDYIEFSIAFPKLDGLFGTPDLPEIECSSSVREGLKFEISQISEPYFNLIMKDQEYGDELSHREYEELTLKIYNLNSELQLKINEGNFYEEALNVAKNIIFTLSFKYGLDIKISSIIEVDSIVDRIDEIIEIMEEVQEKDLSINAQYDKDLINYYYRALQMEDSEFKYMAFYQVLECIYDEVLMANTVESIKQLISSNWFNYTDDQNISLIIEKIKLHNNSKKDEDKLRLVLEKYFKGNLSDEIFLEVNKEIADLLLKMNKIKKVEELKDLQKIQQTIYRFRCDCTHSNRAYPVKRVEDNNSLSDYIKLIKLISSRIILNYRK